ncbi:hypothetical protein BG015_008011 [Linnemannia schmuckeri]|uniref:C2H2-type domain-containing protein n=1 Tax=Linnemannia schmuckeri TaxID=64567 RepID=A0A9P5S126_9FUNG|nr:hypothetical protein BG015_008011 [Linnemannia schmuckeri]
MFPSTYSLGNQTQNTTTTLQRENTDEISKMFTTLYDGDAINSSPNLNSSNSNNNSVDFIQEYFLLQHQELRQQSSSDSQPFLFHTTSSMSTPAPWNLFTPTPVSPASPTSSCFSSSGNDTETESESVYSSPAIALIPYPSTSAANTSIDAAIMVDHMDEDSVEYSNLFSRIESLFSNNHSIVEGIAAVVAAPATAAGGNDGSIYEYPAAEFALFTEHLREQQQQEEEKTHHRHHHAKCEEALHISDNAESHHNNNSSIYTATTRTTGGPQRSSSLSPQQQEQQYYVKQAQDQDDDAMSTYSSSSSLSSAPSSRASSPETSSSTTTTTTTTDGSENMMTSEADGTTTITNQKDGSIMCFNRTTNTMSFRCDLCPTQTQSFGRIHDLKRHQATKHATAEGGAAKTWPCEFCEKPFARRDALLRHYSVKAAREDGVHPGKEEVDVLAAVRARAKLI